MVGLIAPESAERADLAALLGERGYQVAISDPSASSVQTLLSTRLEAILFDLAAADAMKLIRRHAAQWRRVPLVCFADRRRPGSGSEALRLGAVDIIARPLRVDVLQAALTNVAELAGLRKDDAPEPALPIDPASDGVFGISPAMQDVMALVRRVAPSSCSVIIVGERGTGREMVARAIHTRSPRRDGPFVKIAAAAAEPGDFAPLFETPEGGRLTIYLENLSELRTSAQAALGLWLRQRRGRQAQLPAEADRPRVIASGQPNAFDMVDRGLLSRELMEALAVVRIDLAPLRQRPEDIQMLSVHFLAEACREAKVSHKTFTRGALQLLRALPWRGNAAELKSLCERLNVVVPRGVVQLEDVLANVRLNADEGIGRPHESLRVARERFERDYIAAVVQQNHGRIGAAAKQLGIERTNLYRKLKQLNITT